MTGDNFKDIKRAIAVHGISNDVNAIADAALADILHGIGEVVVFAPANMSFPENMCNAMSKDRWIAIPESADTTAKQKNFIIDWFEQQEFGGFLHLTESSVKFNTNSKVYAEQLEHTMDALDYDIHFSTITDKCNYVFNKFCPSIEISIDDDIYKQKLGFPDKIRFTSNSNLAYMTFNFSKLDGKVPKFDDRFTMAMFVIIEYLARRKATRHAGQLYYMNQYLSIGSEVNGYDVMQTQTQQKDDQSAMQKDSELFASLNINYAPDNNLDVVLEAFYNKVKAKLAMPS